MYIYIFLLYKNFTFFVRYIKKTRTSKKPVSACFQVFTGKTEREKVKYLIYIKQLKTTAALT